jgi:uncharacterized protein (TIGR02001 family)
MSLKRTLSIVGLSSSLVGFASAEIESSISAGYNSKYIHRGMDYGDDQASLNLTASGAGAGLDWSIGFVSSSSASDLGQLDESRIHAGMSTALSDSLNFNAGVLHTSYDGLLIDSLIKSNRTEIYVGATTSISGIDLSATVFSNVAGAVGGDIYYELGASYTTDLNITLGATYGNSDEDPFFAGYEDINFLSIFATLNIDLADDIGASVGITHVITDTELTEDETVVGTSLTLSF